jgi:hypothetical protein
LIGTPGSRNGGAPPLWVDLKFTNLSDEAVIYEIGCVHVYQGMLVSENNTWGIKQAFESSYDTILVFKIWNKLSCHVTTTLAVVMVVLLLARSFPNISQRLVMVSKNLISAAFNDQTFGTQLSIHGTVQSPLLGCNL